MTTAQEVFERTMALIDEIDEMGDADTDDTAEYKNKTLPILNILGGELLPYSDTCVRTAGARPILSPILDFQTAIGLDDYICGSIMPYGLAAHLLLDENPSAAAFFNGRYEELRRGLEKGLPTESVDIVDVYGGSASGIDAPYNEFGRWA